MRSPDGFKSSSLSNLSRIPSDEIPNIQNKRKRKNTENDFRDEIKDMLNDWKRQQDTKDLELYNKLKSMESQMSELTSSNIEYKKILETNVLAFNELKNRCGEISDQHKKALERIDTLEERLEAIERKGKERFMEINNIPSDRNFDLKVTVENFHKLLGKSEVTKDINAISQSIKGKKKSIIIEYNDINAKQVVMNSGKAYNKANTLKLNTESIGIEGNRENIFISDLLTQTSKKIYFLVRGLKKSGKIKYCWISRGRVMLRKEDGNPAVQVKSVTQVQDLIDNIL